MSHLLINEPPLQVLPSLAVAIGLNEAIVLQQLHYWQARSTTVIEGKRWVYNSIKQWGEQFPFWSEDTISRALKKLRELGLVVAERLGNDPWDRSLYYRIDGQKMADLTAEKCPDQPENRDIDTRNLRPCHTRNLRVSLTRTETTTERNTRVTPHAPPIPEKKDEEKTKPKAERKTTLRQWLANVKAKGEKAIPEDDPVFAYASKAGIPHDFLALAWVEFRSRYTEEGTESGKKRYIDWRKVYGNAIRGNWLKLWWLNADGQYVLTTVGLQAQRAQESGQ